MNVKFLCFLVIALLLAGCSRQRNQPTASGAGTTQAAAATAQETDPVAGGNPEPVEQPTPAVPAGSPSQSAQFPSPRAGTLAGSAAANASQPPVSAPPVPPEPASAEGGAAPPYPPYNTPIDIAVQLVELPVRITEPEIVAPSSHYGVQGRYNFLYILGPVTPHIGKVMDFHTDVLHRLR